MEMGDWDKASERAQRHLREVKTWATIRTKTDGQQASATKRLALHHACFKLRTVVQSCNSDSTEDPFVEVCRFILLLVQLYPEAAGSRESRHGCLPIHLAAFASCAPRPKDAAEVDDEATAASDATDSARSTGSDGFMPSNGFPTAVAATTSLASGVVMRPTALLPHERSVSEDTHGTNMTAIFAEESFTGAQFRASRNGYSSTDVSSTLPMVQQQPNVSVSMKSNVLISAQREDYAVQVINALLDAFPKGIRVDSEGGRLPLHTACAGRATPRVVATILKANPAAARHRNKDGFLPLHLAAHWGVSHLHVAVSLLKAYPDSTLGRNRWERTPLEEALCMAGENGRPHQAALVRALRRLPSHWTQSPEELFQTPSNRTGRRSHVVDMDDTLPDDETSTDDGDGKMFFQTEKTQLLEEDEEDEFEAGGFVGRIVRGTPEQVHFDLQTLIRRQQWDEIKARLEMNPNEAADPVPTGVLTRGGFVATEGFTLLHYACERRPPAKVVEAFVQAWPAACKTKLQPGASLPLHVACTWHASAQVVRALCQEYPFACQAPDELGNIPLHHAAFSGAVVPVVEVLLQVYPKAALARNIQGSLPADICKRLRHPNKRNVMVLLKSRKEHVLQHRSTSSSGGMETIAQQAMEMTLAEVSSPICSTPLPPIDGEDKSQETNDGVEVQMETNGGDGSEMIWI